MIDLIRPCKIKTILDTKDYIQNRKQLIVVKNNFNFFVSYQNKWMIFRPFSFKISNNTRRIKQDQLIEYCLNNAIYLDDYSKRFNTCLISDNINFSNSEHNFKANNIYCIYLSVKNISKNVYDISHNEKGQLYKKTRSNFISKKRYYNKNKLYIIPNNDKYLFNRRTEQNSYTNT